MVKKTKGQPIKNHLFRPKRDTAWLLKVFERNIEALAEN